MCLTQAARVVAIRPDEFDVEVDGRTSVVASILVPEARVGDDVLVGVGRALALLNPNEARQLRALHQSLIHESAAPAARLTRP
jgi:hydrogenase assembly chaperone HypC/HupF